FHLGTTRAVLVVGSYAFKFARHEVGADCNLLEAKLWREVKEFRRAMLCPVIACSPNGAVLLARAATPLTQAEFFELFYSGGLPDWDYQPHDPDGPDPFEWKPSDWGRIDGRPVSVDYATPAMSDADENFRRWLESLE
ncbi:MAG: hypothetical protein ABSA62_09340, partial [Methyloceanibacter sp.]